MKAHQAQFPIAVMADVLQVSRSGFYAWRDRPLSARARQDVELVEAIRSSHTASDGSYGALRIHADLKDEGFRVGKKRVARLGRTTVRPREHGVVGVTRRRGPTTTTRSPGTPKGPDLVEREFAADCPDALWVADITYVPTGSGFLYLAVVLDRAGIRPALQPTNRGLGDGRAPPDRVGAGRARHGRRAAQARERRAPFPARLGGAGPRVSIHVAGLRRPVPHPPLVGGKAGVRPSLGSVGDCWAGIRPAHNAMCESFFATLECELIDRRRFGTKAEARMALFQFIEGWYNPRRRHSALGYDSPITHEQNHHEALAASYS